MQIWICLVQYFRMPVKSEMFGFCYSLQLSLLSVADPRVSEYVSGDHPPLTPLLLSQLDKL